MWKDKEKRCPCGKIRRKIFYFLSLLSISSLHGTAMWNDNGYDLIAEEHN
jgi:hypothetical protein